MLVILILVGWEVRKDFCWRTLKKVKAKCFVE